MASLAQQMAFSSALIKSLPPLFTDRCGLTMLALSRQSLRLPAAWRPAPTSVLLRLDANRDKLKTGRYDRPDSPGLPILATAVANLASMCTPRSHRRSPHRDGRPRRQRANAREDTQDEGAAVEETDEHPTNSGMMPVFQEAGKDQECRQARYQAAGPDVNGRPAEEPEQRTAQRAMTTTTSHEAAREPASRISKTKSGTVLLSR